MSTPGGHKPGGRRDSVASSSGSPFRQRRSSLSIASPPSPSLPLAAAASINASMRGGSPGPATTARDDAASRRSSVVADLALADDKLPPPAEIAASDRKRSLADNLAGATSRVPNLNTQSSMTGSISGASFSGGGQRGSTGGSLGGSPTDPFKAGALRDPLSNAPGESSKNHHRTPSISQVHQEMEQEQEAQVNRLLITIHQQQQQIESLQRQLETTSGSSVDISQPGPILSSHLVERIPSSSSHLGTSTPGADHPPAPPTPQRAHSTSSAGTTVASTMPAGKPSPTLSPSATFTRPSAAYMSLAQRPPSSRGSSRAASPGPRLTKKSSTDGDENKYWQAEAGNLSKENELLKQKIRELERQLKEGEDSTTRMAID